MNFYSYNKEDNLSFDGILKGYNEFKAFNKKRKLAQSLNEEFDTSSKKSANLMEAESLVKDILLNLDKNSSEKIERISALVFKDKLDRAMKLIAKEFNVGGIDYVIMTKHGNPINYNPSDLDRYDIYDDKSNDNKFFYSPISPLEYLRIKDTEIIFEKGKPKFDPKANYKIVLEIEIRSLLGVLTPEEFVCGVCLEILNHIFVKLSGFSTGMMIVLVFTLFNTLILFLNVSDDQNIIRRKLMQAIVLCSAAHRIIFGEKINARFRRVLTGVFNYINGSSTFINHFFALFYKILFFFKYSKFMYDVLFVPLRAIIMMVLVPATIFDVYIPKLMATVVRFLKRYFVGSLDVTSNDAFGTVWKHKYGCIEFIDSCAIQRGYSSALVGYLNKTRIPGLSYHENEEDRSKPIIIAITSISNIYCRLISAGFLNPEINANRVKNARNNINQLKNMKGLTDKDRRNINQSIKEIDRAVEENEGLLLSAHFGSKEIEKSADAIDTSAEYIYKALNGSHSNSLNYENKAKHTFRKHVHESKELLDLCIEFTYENNKETFSYEECVELVQESFKNELFFDIPFECLSKGDENILL